MIAMDLRKQQALDVDPKSIQKINFTANLDQSGIKAMYFILDKLNETVLDFSQKTVVVL